MTTVSKSLNISAPADRIRAILLDVERYPQWQRETTNVVVQGADPQGRPARAAISVSALGQAASYVVEFDYPDDATIAYRLIEGDLMTKQDATFRLEPADADTTDVTAELEVEVKWALPAFMIEQVSLKGVKDMLKGLQTQAEK